MKTFRLSPFVLFAVLILACEEQLPSYTLHTNTSPVEGGYLVTSPDQGAFEAGQKITIYPKPNKDWIFKQWQGDVSGNSNPLEIRMDSVLNIVAVFVKREYPLALKIIGNGRVEEVLVSNPSGREYPQGSTVDLIPIADEGWVFESWIEENANGDKVSMETPKRIKIETTTQFIARFVPKPNGEPKFFLSENGITCKCENVIAGTKGLINGIEYEAVTNDYLRFLVREKADLTKICTSLVTDMTDLFFNMSFNRPIGNWDVSNVTTMAGMFAIESEWVFWDPDFKSFNQPIDKWDVSQVTNMDRMFRENLEFNQDLSKWCVAKIPTIPKDFTNSAWTLPKPIWGTCPD
jgi:surface protein